mmetsp:Transcript_11835/g.21350  ORF Transcript_11835/g.21350 Transcript_11835/m.21350 type:complete len:275 (-) Transcript_11835:1129-1953(-)
MCTHPWDPSWHPWHPSWHKLKDSFPSVVRLPSLASRARDEVGQKWWQWANPRHRRRYEAGPGRHRRHGPGSSSREGVGPPRPARRSRHAANRQRRHRHSASRQRWTTVASSVCQSLVLAKLIAFIALSAIDKNFDVARAHPLVAECSLGCLGITSTPHLDHSLSRRPPVGFGQQLRRVFPVVDEIRDVVLSEKCEYILHRDTKWKPSQSECWQASGPWDFNSVIFQDFRLRHYNFPHVLGLITSRAAREGMALGVQVRVTPCRRSCSCGSIFRS